MQESERKSKIKHSHSSQRLHISARWSSRKKQPCKTLWNWPWRTQKKYVKSQEVSIFECLDWNTKEVQLRDRNENRKTARWAEKLTDFDLARLPRVWIVLDMRVRVLEVAGSWGQERTNKIKFSSRTRAQKSKAGMFKLG